jgi:hypothetical protein
MLRAFHLGSRGKAGAQQEEPSIKAGSGFDYKLRTTPGIKIRRSVNYLILE